MTHDGQCVERPASPINLRPRLLGSRSLRMLSNRLLWTIGVAGCSALLTSPNGAAQPAVSLWDPLLPNVASAGAPGDPVAVANASFRATAIATETTVNMGRAFLASLGVLTPAAGPAVLLQQNRVYGSQAIEYVIRRAATQIGTPYSWGGGALNGPSRGVGSGASTVGYDCSGLTRYAYAGVGVMLPRYSGDQYTAGRQVPPAQAKRGDLLFWGPGGSQHEAIYLGGGQMLEAQQTGVPVKVSPVRLSGMTPYVVRVIDA